MKSIDRLAAILCISSAVLNGCQDDAACPTCDNFSDGFVIGFDPCSGVATPNAGSVAFAISIPSKGDTVVAYNFPSGIYEFPEEYFVDYRFRPFFPDSAAADYPIKIKYRYPRQSERTLLLCQGDILSYTLFYENQNEVVILSITK